MAKQVIGGEILSSPHNSNYTELYSKDANLEALINTNASAITVLQTKTSQHDSTLENLQSQINGKAGADATQSSINNLQGQINNKANQEDFETVTTDLQDQIDTLDSEKESKVVVADVQSQLNIAKGDIEDLDERIDTLIIESGTSDAETIAARGGHATLGARLNAMASKHYKWIETKTLVAGQTQIVLDNQVVEGDYLIVRDKSYGCNWYETDNFTIESQTITFLIDNPLEEDLIFEVINLGQ